MRKLFIVWAALQFAEIAVVLAVLIEAWGFFVGPHSLVYPAGFIALILAAIVWFVPRYVKDPEREVVAS